MEETVTTAPSEKIINVRKHGESSILHNNSQIPEEYRKITVPKQVNYLEVFWKEICDYCEYIIGNAYLLCFLIMVFWLALGIVFYVHVDYWTPATAFYYSVEAGMSIGFCYPSEISDSSRIYTVFYVMIASSAVSGVVGLTLTIMFSHRLHLVPAEHRINAITYRNQFDEITIKSIANYIWYHFKYFIGWYSNRFRTMITIAFVFWIGVGTMYGMLEEKYTFITALYWAITSCATGGLQTPPCKTDPNGDGTTCDMGTMRGVLMGVYMLIGVPIYAITVSQYARSFLAPLAEYRERELMNRPIEDAQFLYAANVLSPEGSETLVLGEYIILELMRLGLVDQESIESYKKKFYELDIHNKGELELSDLQATGKVIPRKTHSIDRFNRFRTSSLEFFTKNFGSPIRAARNWSAGNESELGLDSPSRDRGRQSSFGRVNSARDFFELITGGPRKDSASNIVIELPPKKRRPTKKAFRKSIRKSTVIENEAELGHPLDRSRLRSSSNQLTTPTRGSSSTGGGGIFDNDLNLSPIPITSTSPRRRNEYDDEENYEENSSAKQRQRAQYAGLFDDFDFNEDDDHGGDSKSQEEDHPLGFDLEHGGSGKMRHHLLIRDEGESSESDYLETIREEEKEKESEKGRKEDEEEEEKKVEGDEDPSRSGRSRTKSRLSALFGDIEEEEDPQALESHKRRNRDVEAEDEAEQFYSLEGEGSDGEEPDNSEINRNQNYLNWNYQATTTSKKNEGDGGDGGEDDDDSDNIPGPYPLDHVTSIDI